MSTPNKEAIRKWVDALRSGKYKQATGQLRVNDSYCCLGVACELTPDIGSFNRNDHFVSKITTSDGSAIGSRYTLIGEVAQHYGLEVDPQVPVSVARPCAPDTVSKMPVLDYFEYVCLSVLNDKGATFEQIANMIEAVWLSGDEPGE